MDYKIYSFATDDLDPDVLLWQRRVFDKFGLSFEQVVLPKNPDYNIWSDKGGCFWHNDHSYFLQNTLRSTQTEYVVFFDVDCIPITDTCLPTLLDQIKDKNTLAGAVQSNHDFGIYMSAYFVGFATQLYFDCGAPSTTIMDIDPFVEFTKECSKRSKSIKYWYPSSSRCGEWKILNTDLKYGKGTTFENMVYHEFQIRRTDTSNFIEKCKWVINNG